MYGPHSHPLRQNFRSQNRKEFCFRKDGLGLSFASEEGNSNFTYEYRWYFGGVGFVAEIV